MGNGFMAAGGSGLPDRNTVGKNGAIGINARYPSVALTVGDNAQVGTALDGNSYLAIRAPKGEYKGESYVGAAKTSAAAALGVPSSVQYSFSGSAYVHAYTLGNAIANVAATIRGLPYSKMTINSASNASASYTNGTLTVSVHLNTGEVGGSGMVERTSYWSITVTLSL